MKDIGVYARREAQSKQRNKELAQLESHIKTLITKAFPNPQKVPSQRDFELAWRRFITDCDNTIGTKKDYRFAYNFGVNTIRRYKTDYGWPYSPPSYLVSHKEHKQLRTKEWLNQAWAANDFYHTWFDSLLQSSALSPSEIYRNVLLSFLFHSAQCQDKVLIAFHQALSKNTLILRHWHYHVFCDLELTSKGLNTNCYVEGEKTHIHHAYLHPITLGLLRQWEMCNRKEWEPPSDKHLCSFLKKGLAKGKNIPTSLRQFCKTAIYTTEHQEHVELSQALVECQIGRVKTYGLPLDNLARLSLSSVNSLSNFEFYASSAKITGNKSSNSNVNTISNKDLFTKLKQCFSKTKVNNNKLSRQVVSRRLQNLVDNGPYTIGESLLLKWFIQKSQVCSPSSLMQYHCSLSRRWLYMTEDCDFSYLDSELLEQMYTSIIGKIEKPGARKYFIARLKDIHQFGSLLNHLPNISSQFFEQDISQHHTRSGFIDEALFNALLNHIDCLIDLNDDEKCCLKSLCIISYRCGLRLSELQKLQLCNIEVSDIGWIDIRNNRFGSNKTASSLRKVPLFPLLLEHEKTIIESHLSQQRLLHPAPNSLVFSLGLNPYQLFDAGDVSRFVGETLKALSGLNHLVFHHLRHSCCSQLQLIFELNQELDERPTLCPYTSVQRSKIKQLLKGESLQKGYFAIASLVGHESPEMTFAHYFHFSDLIAHLKVKRSVNALTPQQKVKLGISTRQKKYASEQEHTHCLIQKLKIKPLSSKITNHRPQKAIISKTKTTSSLQLCYRVLLEYQQGLSLKEITNKYYISQEDVDKWITNAYYIKSLKTNNIPPRSRHFSKARSLLILPAPLQSNAEIILVDKLIVGIREHYINNKDNIKTMLDYALKNTCVSKSGIYFNDPMILETFIKTFACIVSKSSWRAITHYHQHSDVLEKWRSVLKGVKKKVGRKSKGTMRTQGAVRLEYISPIERNIKNKGSYKKYSTHTLIYLFHIMAIMMLNLPTKSNTRILTKKKTYVPNALLKL